MQIGSPEEEKFHIVLLGDLYTSESVGREILIRFARHLVYGHKSKDSETIEILQKSVLHILLSVSKKNSKDYYYYFFFFR